MKRPEIVLRFEEGAAAHQYSDRDAVVLAHEMGHWCRWREGDSPAYRLKVLEPAGVAANLAVQPLEVRKIVLEEETGAWDKARDLLGAAGFDDWALYEQLRDECLRGYRAGLGLE